MPIPDVVGRDDTHRHISAGVNAIGDLLAATLGPTTGFVVNTRPNDELEVLDDAAVIARRIIALPNSRDNIGAMMMRHLVWRVGSETGDGGAIAAVLMQALYTDALRLMSAGYHPVYIEKGITQATAVVIDALRKMARPVENENQLVALAQTIIRDSDLAAVIGEMRYLLGEDGHVIIRDYTGRVLRRRYIAGTYVAAKAASRNFFSAGVEQEVTLNKVALAISETRLWEVDEAVNLMQVALKKGAESLMIITPQLGDQVLGTLTANHHSKDVKLKIFAVQIAEEGVHHEATLQDLCLLTGATLLGKLQGRTAEVAQPEDLGLIPRISYEDKMLTLLTGKNASPQLESAIKTARKRLQRVDPDDDDTRLALTKRLSRLTGGVGELKLGALSKPERKMLNHQAERALKALAVAQRGGVVAGGGAAYIHARKSLNDIHVKPELKVGFDILYRALAAPMNQILYNSKHVASGVVIDTIECSNEEKTFNVLNGNFVNAFDSTLIDPVEVLVSALHKASSMAVRALMTDAIVFHRDPKIEGNQP